MALEKELKEFKDSTDTQLEKLNRKVEDLINEKNKLQSQRDEILEAKGHLENDYEKEVTELKRQISELGNIPKSSDETEGSQIVQAGDLKRLKEWIPKSSSLNEPSLRLIYRASREGWEAKDFHTKCDDVSPTITVIQSKDYGFIFGGYITRKWGPSWRDTEDEGAFLFSLTQGEKYKCINTKKATYAFSDQMVVFGSKCDLSVADCCNINPSVCNFPDSYECPHFSKMSPESNAYLAGANKFKVEELEVYQVI